MEFIKKTIQQKIKDGETPSIDFTTPRDDFGHVQLSNKSWGTDWGIFLNGVCVHTSKTWNSCERKLWLLGLTINDFEL